MISIGIQLILKIEYYIFNIIYVLISLTNKLMTILILVSCLHLQILKNQLHEYLENHINEYDKIVVDVKK